MAFRFFELARQDGWKTQVSQEAAVSSCTFHLRGVNDETPPTPRQLSEFVSFFIGSIDNLDSVVSDAVLGQVDAGKVLRSLPKFHPFMVDLAAGEVSSITGEGAQTAGESRQLLFRDSVGAQFTHYLSYFYTVVFTKRPYPFLANEQINQRSGTFYLVDGTGRNYRYVDEWRRFTQIHQQPSPETATASYGGCKFRTNSGATPNDAEFTGQTYLFLENETVELDWYQVPLRYMRNYTAPDGTVYRSYLTRFVNHVNQFDWNGYPAGTLLYEGAQVVNQFTPAVPKVRGVLGIGLGVATDLGANLRLKFKYTARQGTDVPAAGTKGLTNLNRVAAGHNLLPNFADRKFYYATATGPAPFSDETKWAPTYPSFPFELLFTDPLLKQPGGPI